MRIAISSATSNPAAPAPANPSSPGGAFQSILASASQQGPAAGDPTTNPGANGATGKQGEAQQSSNRGDAGSDTTAASSSAEKNSTATDAASSQQQVNNPSASNSSVVASSEESSALSNPSSASAASQAAISSLPLALSWLSNLSGQGATANSFGHANAANNLTGLGARTVSTAGPAARTSGKQEKAQADAATSSIAASSSAAVLPAIAVLPPGGSTGNSSSVLGNSNRQGNGSAGAFAQDAQTHTSLQAAAQQHATSAKETNAAQGPAGAVDGNSPASATDTSTASTQGVPTAAAEVFTLPEGFAGSALAPMNGVANGAGSLSAGKAAPKDGAGAKNPDLAGTTDDGTTKSISSGSADASVQGVQGSSQSTIHAQADGSQAAAITAKVAENGAPPVQTIPVHGLAPDTAHKAPDSPAAAPGSSAQRGEAPLGPSDSGEAGTASGINAAKLIQSMGETEMHVGLRSTEFGDISIRTSVSQQQLLAQISLDHADLSQAITAHISSVQAKLGSDYGLQASIQVDHQGSAFSGDSGQSSPREQRGFTSSTRIENFAPAAETDSGSASGALVSSGDGYRLDIRA